MEQNDNVNSCSLDEISNYQLDWWFSTKNFHKFVIWQPLENAETYYGFPKPQPGFKINLNPDMYYLISKTCTKTLLNEIGVLKYLTLQKLFCIFLKNTKIQMKPHIYYFEKKEIVDSEGIILTNDQLFKQYLEGWITFLNTRTYTSQQKYVQTFVFVLFFCFNFFANSSTKTKIS